MDIVEQAIDTHKKEETLQKPVDRKVERARIEEILKKRAEENEIKIKEITDKIYLTRKDIFEKNNLPLEPGKNKEETDFELIYGKSIQYEENVTEVQNYDEFEAIYGKKVKKV